jgi:hypothetical protein
VKVRVSGKADRAEGLLHLRDTDTSLITFREKQLSLAQTSLLPTKKVQTLKIRGKETQLYNAARARVFMLEGGCNTLGIDDTFSEDRPSLGRRRGPETSPGSRPEQAARPVASWASANHLPRAPARPEASADRLRRWPR